MERIPAPNPFQSSVYRPTLAARRGSWVVLREITSDPLAGPAASSPMAAGPTSASLDHISNCRAAASRRIGVTTSASISSGDRKGMARR
jgi:hypothetical protein